jgi:PAS domain S-box-containing protein
MSLRSWHQENPNLHSKIAVISVTGSAVAGIALIVLQKARQGRIEPLELVGMILLLVTGCAFNVYVRLSKNRLSDDIARREQIERVLRESENKYRDLVENSPVGIVVSSFDGRVLEVNETLVRMHGYKSKEEFAQSSVADRFYDLKDRERWVAKVWDTGWVEGAELRTKRKDGSLFWSSLTSIPRTTETGEQQLFTVVQDVTKRRDAEDALKVTTALLQAQVEASQEGILVSNDHGGIVLSNTRFREMWRIPGELIETGDNGELLRYTAAQVPDPGSFFERVRQFGGRSGEKGEDTIDLTDGRTIYRYTSPLVDATGTYQGRIWYFRDVTAPRKMRDKLARSGDEWRSTFDAITDAISVQDRDFRLVKVNRAYADLFHKEPGELEGKACYELVHGTNCPIPGCPHAITLKTGQPASQDSFEPHLGAYLEVHTSPMVDGKGNVVGSVHIARNVTRRREMEQQLLIADRLVSIGELVTGVAHELNNPLTTVVGFSQLLMERGVSDDVKRDLSLVHSEAQRAADIVANLLTFARKHDAVKQITRIEDVIENVLKLRAHEEEVGNIRVVRRFAPDLPEVVVDHFQMQQVFLNIITNAEFFMTEAHGKGVLTITVEMVNGSITISIADDGPGIPQDNLSRLFDPFFTTKEVGKGTGLGLSICHGIVADHSGRIYATSHGGAGATFVVELPINGNDDQGGPITEKDGLSEISGGTFGRFSPVTGPLGKTQGGVRL